jgi:hypothetical protein
MLHAKKDRPFGLANLMADDKRKGHQVLEDAGLIRKGRQDLTIKAVWLNLASHTGKEWLVVLSSNFIATVICDRFQSIIFTLGLMGHVCFSSIFGKRLWIVRSNPGLEY